MYIYGFPLNEDDVEWSDDPFGPGRSPEDEICEICHVYRDREGNRYIGIELALNLDMGEMREILSPYSDDLGIRRVVVL